MSWREDDQFREWLAKVTRENGLWYAAFAPYLYQAWQAGKNADL